MSQPKNHYSEIIINQFPQKLALIYKSFVEAEVDNRPDDAVRHLHLFTENLIKHTILFLACDQLQGTTCHNEMRSKFKRHFCDRPTFGRSIDFLYEFFDSGTTTEMSHLVKNRLILKYRRTLKEFTDAYKPGDHSAIRDERHSTDLLMKFGDTIQELAQKMEVLINYRLAVHQPGGVPISLIGVGVPLWDPSFCSAKIHIIGPGKVDIAAWPFFLLEESRGKCEVRALEQLNTINDREVVYYGVTTSSVTRVHVTNPQNEAQGEIITSLEARLGPLVNPPRRIYTDEFQDKKVTGFTGRKWLLKRLDNFVRSPLDEDRLFIIYGMPGAGKTSVIAEHKRQRDFGETELDSLYNLRSYYFIERSSANRKNLRTCFDNLVNDLQKQTAVATKQVVRGLSTAKITFADSFREFRDSLERAEPTIRSYKITLIIDGVDELDPEDIGRFVEQVNDIRRLEGYRVVLTSRRIKELESLVGTSDSILIDNSPENLEDLRFYANSELPDWKPQELTCLVEKTGGCIYYLGSLIKGIKRNEIRRDEISAIPTDFSLYLGQLLRERMASRFRAEHLSWEKFGKVVVSLLIVQREPLSVEQLSQVSGKPSGDIRKAISLMQELFKLVEFERLRENYYSILGLLGGEEFNVDSYIHDLRREISELEFNYTDVRKIKLHAYVSEYFEQEFASEIENAHRSIVDFYWNALYDGRMQELDDYFYSFAYDHIVAVEPTVIDKLFSEPRFYQAMVEWVLTPNVTDSIDDPNSSYWGKCWSECERFNVSIATWLHRYFGCSASNAPDLRHLVLNLVKFYPVFRTLLTPKGIPLAALGFDEGLCFHSLHWIEMPPGTVGAGEDETDPPYCSCIPFILSLRFPQFAKAISSLDFGVLESIVSKVSLRDLGIWQAISTTECDAVADLPSWHETNMSESHFQILKMIAERDSDLVEEQIGMRWEKYFEHLRQELAKQREEPDQNNRFLIDEYHWEKQMLRSFGLDDLVRRFEMMDWRTAKSQELTASNGEFLASFQKFIAALQRVVATNERILSNGRFVTKADVQLLHDRLLMWIAGDVPLPEQMEAFSRLLPVFQSGESYYRILSYLLRLPDVTEELRILLRERAFQGDQVKQWVTHLNLQEYLYRYWPKEVLESFTNEAYPRLVLDSPIAWNFLRSKDPMYDNFKEALYNSVEVVDTRKTSYSGFGRVIDVNDDENFFLARLCRPIEEFEGEVFDRLSTEDGEKLMKVWFDNSKLILTGSMREIIGKTIEEAMTEGANTRALLEKIIRRVLN